MGWTEQDIATARNALSVLGRDDPYGRMSAKLVADGIGPQPWDPSLGLVANIIRGEPGIVQRIRDEGFDARVQGKDLISDNPHTGDGKYGWWREGWFAADDNMRDE